jgi:hypothetical protein
MSGIALTVSPESLAGLLPGVESQLVAEQAAAPIISVAQREAVTDVATAAIKGETVPPAQASAAGFSSEDLTKLTDQLAENHKTLGEIIKEVFNRSDKFIERFAQIVVERAEALKVSAARYLEELQKHLLQYLIATYLLDPIPIKLSTGPATLGATSINLQATVTLQPTVSAGVDVIQGFVASLFNMSFELTVGYGSTSST